MNAYTFWKELDSLSSNLTEGLLSPAGVPRVDVVEAKDHYELVAELPGFSKDQVTVQVKDGVLEIAAGEQKSDAPRESLPGQGETQWLLRERRQLALHRSFRLPRDVNSESIEAAFRDGLLVLTLPKREETKPRLVSIKAA